MANLPVVLKLQNVEACNGLETWGQLVFEFEPRTAGNGKEKSTTTKRVSEHLFLFADKLQAYADARKVVFEFIDARRAQCAAGAAVPMDVDALSQKSDKGKDGKGRKHDQEANKDKSREKFAGECWICGKTGHKSRELAQGKGKGKATKSFEENEEQQPADLDAVLLELSSLTSTGSTPPLSAHLQRDWLRVNFDSGAAASVFQTQESPGQQKFRTASGEELADVVKEGTAESGEPVLKRMRLTEVHKPLASAHRANVAYVNAEGGMLFPKDSAPGQQGRKLEEYATKLWHKCKHLVVPLYQERGLYNLYVKPSAGLSEQNLGATSAEAA
eukprot:4005103-Amphidinium_carterae.1